MSEHHSPRQIGFVSAISDTDIKDKHVKDHNPIHQAAHYLKNAVTFESKDDERSREAMISDQAHRDDHGGKQAKADFWEKHKNTILKEPSTVTDTQKSTQPARTQRKPTAKMEKQQEL